MDIAEIINQYGILACFIIILLEYACFPISSEIVLPLSGYVAKQANVTFFYIWILSVLAGVIGITICYVIGSLGGKGIFIFLNRRFPKIKAGLARSEEKFSRNSNMSCLFLRFIPLCRTYISFVAGIYQKNYLKFVVFSSIGIAIWNFILILLGYYFYDYFQDFKNIFSGYEMIILLSFLLIMYLYLIFFEIKKTNN